MNRFFLLTALALYSILIFEIGWSVGGKLIFISHELQKVDLRPILAQLEKMK